MPQASASTQAPDAQARGTIQQLFARYRRQVAIRAVAQGALGLLCLAALAARLRHADVAPPWILGVWASGLLVLGLWQRQAIRRDRLWNPQVMLALDRVLGLKARLLTAIEFASAASPPSLYPRLLQDTAQAFPMALKRAPRATDRWTYALAIALLFLMGWPKPPASSAKLAMQPPSEFPLPEPTPPPLQPPLSDQQQPSQDQQRGGSGAQGERAAGQQGSQDGQRTSSSTQSGQGGEASRAEGASKPSSADHAQGPSQPSPADRSGGSGQQEADASAAGQQPSSRSSDAGRDQRQSQTEDQARQAQERAASSQDGTSGQARQQANDRGASSQDASAHGRQGAADRRQGAESLSALTQGAGTSQSASAQQDLLKADIQQLLKELSSELKQLQAQLDTTSHNQPSPLPGTATDPSLYDARTSLPQAAGAPLPIQLQVDAQPTAAPRPGSGVGDPSEQVASADPKQQAESAQLAQRPIEEEFARPHQPIPPEYRPVFERLSNPDEN